MKELKPKKCKVCGKQFEPRSTFQVVCGFKCSYVVVKEKRLAEKKKTAEMKKSLLTHKDYLKMLQVVFNTYIRKRDEQKGCISCGVSLIGKKFDAGHYFSCGGYPNVRFEEINVHGQCVHCNQHKHGNIHEYTERLPKRIGIEEFEALKERAHMLSNKLTIAEIKEKIKYYKNKLKNT
jgi:hypothetical protein